MVTVKHATASTFVFGRRNDGWRIGLILHPLLGRLMIPGGHVEPHESAPQAARREVLEESGLHVRFLPAPSAATPPSIAASGRLVSPPWWIMEQPIAADNHLAEVHFHVDHLYVALADDLTPVGAPAHPFGWHRAHELAGLHMFDDTRTLAAGLFTVLDDLTVA